VTLKYSTDNSSGIAGSDYQGIATTSLTFNPGETQKTISIKEVILAFYLKAIAFLITHWQLFLSLLTSFKRSPPTPLKKGGVRNPKFQVFFQPFFMSFCPLNKGAAASAGGSVHLKRVAANKGRGVRRLTIMQKTYPCKGKGGACKGRLFIK